MDQSHYCRDIRDLYGMSDSNPCLLPMNPRVSLAKAKSHECLSETAKRRYQAMIESLGDLMSFSHPDCFRGWKTWPICSMSFGETPFGS